MKKILLLAASLVSISTSVFAYDELLTNNNYKENNWWKIYLKANFGASLLHDIKDSATSVKMKSKAVPYIAVGIGTYFMDNTRVDITFEHFANSNLKKTYSASLDDLAKTNIGRVIINNTVNDTRNLIATKLGYANGTSSSRALNGALDAYVADPSSGENFGEFIVQAALAEANRVGATQQNALIFAQSLVQKLSLLQSDPATSDLYYLLAQDFSDTVISTSISRKPTINAFMVNGTVDLYELNRVKFFIGAGLGLAQVKEKITLATSIRINGKDIGIVSGSASTKKANNFAYSLTAGTAVKVNDRATIELAYGWKDFGKTKSLKFQGIEVGKTPFRSHTLSAGIRVDI
jgi:opacity protein-like surface antigen